MGMFAKGVALLEAVGFKLLHIAETFDTFTRHNEDSSTTFLDISKKDGTFSIFTQYEESIIAYDLPIDVAVAIVEYAKGLGI